MTSTVFIDANIFIREGKLEDETRRSVKLSPSLRRLSELAKVQLVKVIVTDLTLDEVAKKHATNRTALVPDLSRPAAMDAFREIYRADVEPRTKDQIYNKFLKDERRRARNLARQLRARVLNVDEIPASAVLNDYTEKVAMFSQSAKKDQFPDAFIHKAVKNYQGNDENIIFLADDKDFDSVIDADDSLERTPSLLDLLERIDNSVLEAPVVMTFLNAGGKHLIEHFEIELNDYSLSDSEIEDSEIEQSTVIGIEFSDIESFGNHEVNELILVSGKAKIEFNASYYHPDWDSAMWDSEDKRLIPFDTVSGETETEIEVEFTMSLELNEDGDHCIDALNFIGPEFFEYSVQIHQRYLFD